MKSKKFFVMILCGLFLLILAAGPYFFKSSRVTADPNVYASAIQGGCYIAAANDCRLHVEPFTIELAPGTKLVNFQLSAYQVGLGPWTMIWDFRPDSTSPVPFSGSTFTPSLPTQDFAAGCGKIYTVALFGQDTGDISQYVLGQTNQIHCPSSVP